MVPGAGYTESQTLVEELPACGDTDNASFQSRVGTALL